MVKILNRKTTVKKTNITLKSIFVYVMFILILVGLFGRVLYFKIVKGEEYSAAAMKQHTNKQDKIINPNRGSILDRNEQILAFSRVVYTVILDADVLHQHDEADKKNEKVTILSSEKMVNEISSILEIEQDELRRYLQPKEDGTYNKYKILKKKVPGKSIEQIQKAGIKGIQWEEDSKRSYPHDSLASYVLGYMGGEQGFWGVEQQYNEYLMGTPGRSFTVYTEGNTTENEMKKAIDGDTVITTIDSNIQKFAEQSVANAMATSKPNNASIVVMNPNTGEILAMASSPGFNLNEPNNLKLAGIDDTNMTDEQISDALSILHRNYNISDTYEPGSTFKPMTVAAALEEGIITVNDRFVCNGSKKLVEGEKPIGCWKKTGHGAQSLDQALANSCNVAMMDIGEKMGRDIFYNYQKAFGFGEKTGIDLPGEPSNASFASLMHPLEGINKVELATMSFGQTFNCTPVQLLNAFSAIINGGKLMKPYVVSQIIGSDKNIVLQNEPTIERKVISKEVSDTVRKYLQSVVDSGTGKKIAIEGYNIGGKTGTAQQDKRAANLKDDEYIISFVAFLPVENPEIIAVAVLDRPQKGYDDTAAPMLKEVLENTIHYMGIEPTTNLVDNPNKTKKIVMDDYTGMYLIEVSSNLSMLNLNHEQIGTGSVVVNQFPVAGTEVEEDTTVILYLAKSESGERVEVPELIGKTHAEAITMLEELGIVPTVDGEQDGLVIEQEPKVGTKVDVGGGVRIKFKK